MPCDQEYFRIHDGPAESSNVLVEYCRNGSRDELIEYQLFSSGRSLWVETKKGINNSNSGFIVSYKAMDFEGKGERLLHLFSDFHVDLSPETKF